MNQPNIKMTKTKVIFKFALKHYGVGLLV